MTRPCEASLRLLLVRHAEPVLPRGAGEENERRLSAAGRAAAEALAAELEPLRPVAVYSSPYPRAVETVAPLAARLGLEVHVLDGLRERLLSAAPLADWRAQVERCWADPEHAPPGGESSRVAQGRVLGVLEGLRARHRDGETVVAGSHGNLIALALHVFEPRIGHAFWAAMPMPAAYELVHDGGAWRIVAGPGLPGPVA